jgi:carboxyl-terminal processing protease
MDDRTLLENAIHGLLYRLDPHSVYLEPRDFGDLQVSTSGEFGGIGIEVGMQDGFVRVVTPMDDTPASRAGMKAGDLIVRIDGEAVKGLSLQDAVERMRGPVGSSVTLTVLREGVDESFEVVLKREKIQLVSVRSRVLEPGLGYLRITQFQTNTGSDAEAQLRKLLKEAEHPLAGLVLDLRNNPGGLLNGAQQVADLFLDGGNIVSTRGRDPDAEQSLDATPGDVLAGLPIVVLVNAGTASAAEIVAGALQDHQRAVLLGTTTFGKGSVQTILPLINDRALKLTTARYYTPSGRSIQAQGIVPDLAVEEAELHNPDGDGAFREENLPGHLANGEEKKAADDKLREAVVRDVQLFVALKVLRGLTISKAAGSAAADATGTP